MSPKLVLFANEKDVTIPMLEGDDLRTFENLVESHKRRSRPGGKANTSAANVTGLA